MLYPYFSSCPTLFERFPTVDGGEQTLVVLANDKAMAGASWLLGIGGDVYAGAVSLVQAQCSVGQQRSSSQMFARIMAMPLRPQDVRVRDN